MYLKSKIEGLEGDSDCIHKLASHKKKEILSTIPNLPQSILSVYTIHNVQKDFLLNVQLDTEKELFPSYKNFTHTLWGDIVGTCLEEKESTLCAYYEEVFTNGIIKEESFDANGVVEDVGYDGTLICLDVGISCENCQRSKILTVPT